MQATKFIIANEFGSRATNKLYEKEVFSTRYYYEALKLSETTKLPPEIIDTVLQSAKNMRECELAESAIAYKILQETAPEIDVQEMLENSEQFGVTAEDDLYITQNISFADHPTFAMTLEFIQSLKSNNFFDNSSYITQSTSFACNIPTIPSGM